MPVPGMRMLRSSCVSPSAHHAIRPATAACYAAEDEASVSTGGEPPAPAWAAIASTAMRPAISAVAGVVSSVGAASTMSTPSRPPRATPRTRLDRLAAGEAAGRGGAGSGHVRRVEAVDVEGEVHAARGGAADFACARHRPRGAVLPDLVQPDHGDAVLAAVLRASERGFIQPDMPTGADLRRDRSRRRRRARSGSSG